MRTPCARSTLRPTRASAWRCGAEVEANASSIGGIVHEPGFLGALCLPRVKRGRVVRLGGSPYVGRVVVFPLLLVVGCIGLAAAWLLGLTHVTSGGLRALPHHGAIVHQPSATASSIASKGALTAPTADPSDRSANAHLWVAKALRVLSPLNLFGLLVGAGAVGTACDILGAGPVVAWVAAAMGALIVRFFVIEQLSRLVFRFASRPAQNLDGCMFQEVQAVTRFDKRGEGLVRVQIDGREEDVLGRLTEADRKRNIRVLRGDRLVVEEIDTRRNRCIVSRG